MSVIVPIFAKNPLRIQRVPEPRSMEHPTSFQCVSQDILNEYVWGGTSERAEGDLVRVKSIMLKTVGEQKLQ